MEFIECKFVEFHSPVFAAGKNWGTKVHSGNDIKLFYNVPLRMMFMQTKNNIVFFDSFHSAIPIEIDYFRYNPNFKPSKK